MPATTSPPRTLAVALALLAAAAGGGCSGKKVTEIVVSIATDLQVPKELEAIRLTVVPSTVGSKDDGGGSMPVLDNSWDLRSSASTEDELELPATIGLLPGKDPSEPILISVIGLAKGAERLRRQARLPFAQDRVVLLKMNLLRSCLYAKCKTDETCGENGCEPINKDPNTLPTYHPELVFFDGGTPASEGSTTLEARADLARDASRPDLARDASLPDSRRDAALPDRAADGAVEAAHGDLPRADLPRDAPKADSPPADSGGCVPPTVTKSCTGGYCTIPPGCFTFGTPSGEPCRDATNEMQRQVTITRTFEVSEAEVTQLEYKNVMGNDPSKDTTCGTNCPVEYLSWSDAAAYCNQLSTNAGKTECYTCTKPSSTWSCVVAPAYSASYASCPGYRLPTEAEWEYAARAGSTTALYSGALSTCTGYDANAVAIAWYSYNSSLVKQRVMQKQANAWGLYDMSGNVWEWTADVYILAPTGSTDPWNTSGGTGRVIRGGAFDYEVDTLRSGNRGSRSPTTLMSSNGFRCVRSLTNTVP
jgi:formylglycine-generating enzyme required for sulfatase activity